MMRGLPTSVPLDEPSVRREASHADTGFARLRPPARSRRDLAPPDGTIAFLAASGVSPATIARATADARALGVTADAALLANRTLEEDAFYRALARHIGTAFLGGEARLAPGLDTALAAQTGTAPLQRWPGGPRCVMAPRGAAITALAAGGHARHVVLTTPRRFEALLRDAAPARIALEAASTLATVAPAMCARQRVLPTLWPQLAVFIGLYSLGALLIPTVAGMLLFVSLFCCFGLACVQRIVASFASIEQPARPAAPALSDRELPIYTVVVALYREANMAAEIVAALEALDYPRAKLDIKFVVEVDDHDTRAALSQRLPGAEYDIIVAPDGQPRTKPRALNVALPFARGALVTIFDAEDRPHPDQLRRAAAAFACAPSDVACLQAQLAIDNEERGWRQMLYALDYAALFAVQNTGLAYYDLPIFLGGTSNHFRRDLLVRAGAWDAWNVTEDADLGVRLARFSYRVQTFESRTDEEAPTTLSGFLRQRIRWKKGWMQTFAVHLREPRTLWRDLGALRFASLAATFVSGILGPLFWPFLTGFAVIDVLEGALLSPADMVDAAHAMAVCLLLYCGAVAMLLPLVIGAARCGLRRHLLFLPLLPAWHILLCAAAWAAVWDLLRHPFRWSKTEHGSATRRRKTALVCS